MTGGGPTDTTPPVITLLGSSPIDVVLSSTYTDAGATALDDVDGDLTGSIATVSTVNTSVLGAYTVTYNVSDIAGNPAAQVTRNVNVVAAVPDTTPPVITLLGISPIDVVLNSTYTDAGVTALDDVDGDLTGSIATVSTVNTSALGAYTVTYNVSDIAGNPAAQVIRNVNVVAAVPDTTPPVITLLGSSPIDVVLNSTYTDVGATAFDDVDGD